MSQYNPLPSQYNYPLPKVPITASQVGTQIHVSLGGSFQQSAWIELNNESPYVLSVYSAQGVLLNSLQPQICDIAQIPSGDSSFILIPGLLIPQSAPSSEVDINVYPFGQPQGPYPFPLARQSAPVTGGGKGGYSYPNSNVPGASGIAAYILFNPSNSGVNFLIYSASYSMAGGSTNPTNPAFSTFATNSGISGTSETPTPHTTGGVASKAQLTVNNAFTGSLTNQNGIDQVQSNGTAQLQKEFLPNGDVVTVTPNNGAVITANQLSGIVLYTMNMRWLEQ